MLAGGQPKNALDGTSIVEPGDIIDSGDATHARNGSDPGTDISRWQIVRRGLLRLFGRIIRTAEDAFTASGQPLLALCPT